MTNPNQLILDNLNFVYIIVNKYKRRFGHLMSYDDMVGYGRLGLVIAAHKFDESRGSKFTTHASWWIYSQIQYGARKFGHVIHHRSGIGTWYQVHSLNNLVSDDSEDEFIDFVEDEDSLMEDIDDLIHSREVFDLCLQNMLPREAEAFYHLYKIGKGVTETARVMRVSKQRVGQLKQRAENKARKVMLN